MIIDCAHYRGGERLHEHTLRIGEAAERAAASDGGSDFVWLGLKEPSQEELAEVQEAFGLHELAVEDAAKAHQRPKVEDYEGSYFIVLKTARYEQEAETVHFGEIDIFLASRAQQR